jgi:hypothetical protein
LNWFSWGCYNDAAYGAETASTFVETYGGLDGDGRSARMIELSAVEM